MTGYFQLENIHECQVYDGVWAIEYGQINEIMMVIVKVFLWSVWCMFNLFICLYFQLRVKCKAIFGLNYRVHCVHCVLSML